MPPCSENRGARAGCRPLYRKLDGSRRRIVQSVWGRAFRFPPIFREWLRGFLWGLGSRSESAGLHVLGPGAVNIGEGPIDPRSGLETPATRRKELRAITMGLILVNLLLGAILSTPPTSQRNVDAQIFDCCRGQGPEAYCCKRCCWVTWNCKVDRDCRNPVRK